MRLNTAILVLALAAIVAPAAAQLPQSAAIDPYQTVTPSWTGNAVGDPTSDWGRCAGLDYNRPAPGIRSCGRIIGERVSRAHSAAAHLFRGQFYEAGGDASRAQAEYDDALTMFEEITLSEPRNPNAFTNYAAALVRLARYDDALAAYGRAFALLGNTERMAAEAGTHIGARPNASAVEAAQTMANYHYARGNIYFEKHDYANAALDYDEAARLWPELALFQGARCEARAAARTDLEEAASACEAAIQLAAGDEPRLAHALFSRGYLHFMQADDDAAGRDFSAALQHSEHCEHAWYGEGVLAKRRGQTSDGDAAIARGMAIDPFDIAKYARTGLGALIQAA